MKFMILSKEKKIIEDYTNLKPNKYKPRSLKLQALISCAVRILIISHAGLNLHSKIHSKTLTKG